MPTEDQARDLLARAADTIEVGATAPAALLGLPEPPARRWPVLAAAAVVALCVGAGALAAGQWGDDPPPDPAPAVDPTGGEDPAGSTGFEGLIGFARADAERLLQEQGMVVEVVEEHSCVLPQGLVLGTDPGPGSTLDPGDRVRVRVVAGVPPNVRCAAAPYQDAWDLLRLARGVGDAPDLPDGLSIAVGEGAFVELTADEVADPAAWEACDVDGTCRSVLEEVEQMLTASVRMGDSVAATSLAVTDDPRQLGRDCLTADLYEQGLPYHRPTYVYVAHPVDGIFCPPPPVLQLGWTEDYRLASVRVRLAAVPDQGDVTEEELALDLERRSTAERFVAWARGEGPAPEFADRVRVMFLGGGAFGHPGWTDEPEDRTRYSGCSGLGFPDCGLDPVALLVRYGGPVVPSPGRSTCAPGGEVPSRFADAAGDVVRLEEPEPASCGTAWAVELWIDADGIVYGVNQAGADQ